MPQATDRVIADRYRLLHSLGRGGMGAVWRARDEFLHREVAIKEVHLPAAPDASDPILRRTLREARATARLRHPGIVRVYDVVTEAGRPWIVMELITGGSLARLIREHGPLPASRAARIGLDVVQALDAAHRAGILHRDVKPANILLDGDKAVLTDFGIATHDGATALTGTNQLIGSPEYLAPERINGHAGGPEADLWALGATLYTAVTGRSPFRRPDIQAVLAAVLTAEPDPPAAADDLWPIIEGLLCKDPAKRLTAERTAALLTEPVETAEAAPKTGTGPLPPATVTTRLPARRNRRRIAVLAAAALLVATSILWFTRDAWKGAGAGPTPPSQPSAAPVSTPVSPAPDNGEPVAEPGYTAVEDPKGFWIAVPDDYAGDLQGAYLHYSVDTTALFHPCGTTYACLSDYERNELFTPSGWKVANYQRIRLEQLPSGHAELEYTYRLVDGYFVHEQARAVITRTGQAYIVRLASRGSSQSVADAKWKTAQHTANAMLRSLSAR